MPLKISKFTGPGSTPKRRQFWDSIVDVVISERKLPGKHVVVTEDYGRASLIDVTPQRGSGVTPPPVTCCDRDVTEISTMDVTLSVDADFHGVCGTGSRSETFTWNFVRIPHATAFTPGLLEFKLYFGTESAGCCALFFSTIRTGVGPYSHDWGKADSICEDGTLNMPVFLATFNEACSSGTLTLSGENVIGNVEARFGGDASCNDAPCSYLTSDTGFSDLATDIPITTCDLSSLIGTYTLMHTASSGTDVDVTVTVAFVFA